ncbi:outer envelope pore protein 37, chloroplastic isoform X2 [Brachypodium distachyon]|uniref:Outer envelope pore protein 37, chloroplastic n=1 Tax=Brachypodium distachyon TaxID=15368 RepID=I1ITI9_BRADI|nr:outer envelope pore protein 37, chloroplastic isoform X2 [Brachypodium distachyon]KQJ91829.1 hypothetical protein BRADI_4g40030v3 [Brachypodium distachyon]|eukprot:XP_003578767.1 outer envelope pore protein 37, chloroplastic isoform X2 [Brachypodium distachyon]
MAAPALLSAPQPMDGDGDGVAPHAAPSPTQPPPERGFLSRRPPVRVTSEFDSERKLFSHRISCRVLDGLAKLRLRVHQGAAGGVGPGPEVALVARNFSVVVDTASRGAVLRGAADLAGSLRLRASHNTKEGLGEVAVTTNLGDSPCKMEISSLVPPDGLPRATFVFPNGEVSVKEKKLDEGEKILSVNGIVKSHVLNGVCTALYNDNAMNIKYRYKDDELSFIPSLSLPSNSLSFAFKRQLTPSDKFSYRYHFDTNYWSAVYKQKASKHVKWKAGYESDERLGWASLWVGDAGGKTKETPLKSKIQLMLKVPQDNIQNSIVVFRVKKRWDF